MTYTSERQALRSALYRCYNTAHEFYHLYGARGITVTGEWQGHDGFDNFIRVMGPKPTPDHSLDRQDNDLGYTPQNCRWSTALEQTHNRRCSIPQDVREEIARISEEHGIKPNTVLARYHKGLPRELWSAPVANPRPKPKLSPEKKARNARIIFAHASGLTYREIAAVTGVSTYSASRIVRQYRGLYPQDRKNAA